MPTAKQNLANRRNAQRSTGPKTAGGKARSSRNALQHGILAITRLILPWESSAALQQMQEELFQDWKPHGFMERALVESMLTDLWRMRRLQLVELGVEYSNSLDMAWRRKDLEGSPEKHLIHASGLKEDPDASTLKMPAQILEDVYIYQSSATDIGRTFIEDIKGPDALAKLQRHRTGLQNSIYRTMHELERLQARRARLPMTFKTVSEPAIDEETASEPSAA